jgi:hypothetical protein
MDETWISIPDYEGLYDVSDAGSVRSLPHMTSTGIHGGRTLKPTSDKKGYRRVNLSKDNKVRTFKIATLVLLSFTGPRPDGQEARHLNGNNQDDCLTNLMWGTKSENTLDQVSHGTHWEARMKKCPRCDGELKLRPNGHRWCPACGHKKHQEWLDKGNNREYRNQKRRENYRRKRSGET